MLMNLVVFIEQNEMHVYSPFVNNSSNNNNNNNHGVFA